VKRLDRKAGLDYDIFCYKMEFYHVFSPKEGKYREVSQCEVPFSGEYTPLQEKSLPAAST
jgi:hypothetical protein